MFAFRSILNNSKSIDIPNLRDKAEREKWRNDTACTDKNVAGDMLLPTQKGGTPDIPEEVYAAAKAKWLRDIKADDGYIKAAFTQSSKDDK